MMTTTPPGAMETPPPPAEPPGGFEAPVGNGQFVAVILAAAIGSFVLGVLTILAEGSTSVHDGLQLVDRVGPLSGKVSWALVAFGVSWAALAAAVRRREVGWRIPLIVASVLVAAALVLTFPPVFQSVA